MIRYLLLVLTVALWCGLPSTVSASPLQPSTTLPCRDGSFLQHDMAGNYQANLIMVEISPCGTSQVWWINIYGEHTAAYYTEQRLPGGGLITSGFRPDPLINAYLDSKQTLVIKPAEKGWIQIATFTDEDTLYRIYRLRKME